jgi:hypothetical protein
MANQNAANHKKRHVTVPAKLTDVADQGGRMRVMYDKFSFADLVGANLVHTTSDTISFGKLPPGAKVWDASLHQSATLVAGSTLALGITGTAAAFLVAAASTAVGTRHMREGVANITLAPVTITTETTVIATIAGATATTTTAFVEVRILYTVD